jgi:hypothetical protein
MRLQTPKTNSNSNRIAKQAIRSSTKRCVAAITPVEPGSIVG